MWTCRSRRTDVSKLMRPICPVNEVGRIVPSSSVVEALAESSCMFTGNLRSVNGVLVMLPAWWEMRVPFGRVYPWSCWRTPEPAVDCVKDITNARFATI